MKSSASEPGLSDLKKVVTEVADSCNSGKGNAQCEKHCLVLLGKSKASLWRNFSTGTPKKFFRYNPLFCRFSFQLIFLSEQR